MRRNSIRGLCLILDEEQAQGRIEQAAHAAIAGGVRLLQYRNKRDPRKTVYDKAHALCSIVRSSGGVFIMNDEADIAAAIDADGVHLGQDDLPLAAARTLLGGSKIIGISTHSREQAQAAESGGADYIGFGPLFRTATKDAGAMQGVERLRDVRRAVTIPILAIGGIKLETASAVIAAGADGIAVISAILGAADIERAAQEMILQLAKE